MREVISALLLLAVTTPAFAGEAEMWATLKQPVHFALLRHANSPGFWEEPPGIDLKNCTIQRNLDDAGKAQAREIGEQFRKHGLANVRVPSSQDCRALDTAKPMHIGAVEPAPLFNYFYYQLAAAAEKAITFMRTLSRTRPAVLVAHVSNIKAIAGENVGSGEMVIVHSEPNGKLAVDGRISP
jgi:phosphohistidine phosphatase SixA